MSIDTSLKDAVLETCTHLFCGKKKMHDLYQYCFATITWVVHNYKLYEAFDVLLKRLLGVGK